MKTNREIMQMFGRHFNNSKNFMTPDILEYGQKGIYIYEVSKGDWMGSDIFGLTVLEIDSNPNGWAICPLHSTDFSGMRDSMAEIQTAINGLGAAA